MSLQIFSSILWTLALLFGSDDKNNAPAVAMKDTKPSSPCTQPFLSLPPSTRASSVGDTVGRSVASVGANIVIVVKEEIVGGSDDNRVA